MTPPEHQISTSAGGKNTQLPFIWCKVLHDSLVSIFIVRGVIRLDQTLSHTLFHHAKKSKESLGMLIHSFTPLLLWRTSVTAASSPELLVWRNSSLRDYCSWRVKTMNYYHIHYYNNPSHLFEWPWRHLCCCFLMTIVRIIVRIIKKMKNKAIKQGVLKLSTPYEVNTLKFKITIPKMK